MATVRKEIGVAVPAETAWAALADFGALHRRLARGFVTDCALEAPGRRRVTFASGTVLTELLVACDPALRRLAYTIPDRFAYHGAAAEIVPAGTGACRFVWTTDVLPDAAAPVIAAQMDLGLAAIKATLEAA
jgi:hypothetical protein